MTLTFCVALSGHGSAQNDIPGPAQQPQQQEQTTNQPGAAPLPQSPNPATPTEKQEPKARIYKSACGETEDHNEADLCEQRRMAQAAIDAVWWAAWQTRLGIAGFISVVFSLFFTGWAAIAAGRAAKAAQQSVKVTTKTGERQLRAYVYISSAAIHNLLAEKDGLIKIKIKNFGQTPAYGVTLAIGIRFEAFPLKVKLPDDKFIPGPKMDIGPQGEHEATVDFLPLTEIRRAGLKAGTLGLYVYGKIVYRAAFDQKDRVTEFRMMMGGNMGVDGVALNMTEEGNRST